MYRTKLNLTESEIMKKSWISLQMESSDLPYWDYKAKKTITGEQASLILGKYVKP
jgi:hypothetical protein